MPATPTVSLDGQYRALREEAGLLERPGRAILEIRGSEAAEMLQGQLTNDIEALSPGEGCYAALLDRKGKMRSDMRVLAAAPELVLLDCPEGPADDVEAHMQMYKVGRDVEVARSEQQAVISLIGPGTARLLGDRPLGPEHAHREIEVAGAEARLVSTDLGADLIVAAADAEAAVAELLERGAEPVGAEAAEIVRVESGRPLFGAEMGSDTIPQEAGLNERAVSFEKGCYIGQETVARLHYRGKPNRHLRRLVGGGELEPGETVSLDGKELGVVGTAVISPARGPLALAILRKEAAPGVEVTVGEDRTAVVEEIHT